MIKTVPLKVPSIQSYGKIGSHLVYPKLWLNWIIEDMDRAIFLWGNMDRDIVKKIMILFIDLSVLDAHFKLW